MPNFFFTLRTFFLSFFPVHFEAKTYGLQLQMVNDKKRPFLWRPLAVLSYISWTIIHCVNCTQYIYKEDKTKKEATVAAENKKKLPKLLGANSNPFSLFAKTFL